MWRKLAISSRNKSRRGFFNLSFEIEIVLFDAVAVSSESSLMIGVSRFLWTHKIFIRFFLFFECFGWFVLSTFRSIDLLSDRHKGVTGKTTNFCCCLIFRNYFWKSFVNFAVVQVERRREVSAVVSRPVQFYVGNFLNEGIKICFSVFDTGYDSRSDSSSDCFGIL